MSQYEIRCRAAENTLSIEGFYFIENVNTMEGIKDAISEYVNASEHDSVKLGAALEYGDGVCAIILLHDDSDFFPKWMRDETIEGNLVKRSLYLYCLQDAQRING